MSRALVLCALVACTYPEKILANDAQGTPFGCLGQPLPTTADNPVAVSGTVTDAFSNLPINNVAIAGQLAGLGTSIFVVNTDAAGKFARAQATNNAPLELFLKATASNYIDTYYYPPRPISHDTSFQLSLVALSDAAMLQAAAQLTFDPAKGQILLTVNDCNEAFLAGGTITTVPAGTVRYFAGVIPSATATMTDAQGIAMVANLPPGDITLTGKVGAMTFRSRTVKVVAGAIIVTRVEP